MLSKKRKIIWVVAGLIALTSFSVYKLGKEEWTAFVYIDKENRNNYKVVGVFPSKDRCLRNYSAAATQYKGVFAGYECGLECKLNTYIGRHVCKVVVN